MLIEKKIRPNNLLSGQIDKLLNVGDKKINADNNNKIFSSISLNFNFKHLKKINGKNKHMWRCINLITKSGKFIFSKKDKNIIKIGECLVEKLSYS